jgi:hypothetical protein
VAAVWIAVRLERMLEEESISRRVVTGVNWAVNRARQSVLQHLEAVPGQSGYETSLLVDDDVRVTVSTETANCNRPSSTGAAAGLRGPGNGEKAR